MTLAIADAPTDRVTPVVEAWSSLRDPTTGVGRGLVCRNGPVNTVREQIGRAPHDQRSDGVSQR